MEPQSLTGVGETALGVASVRARETRRIDRVFDDPYAQAFLAAAPEAFTEERAVLEQGEGAAGLAAVGGRILLPRSSARGSSTTTCSKPPPAAAAKWCCSPPGSTPAPSG